MARLYSNENIPRSVVEQLRRLGHDVLTSFDAGNANRSVSDEEVIRFAIDNSRAVLTLNRKHFVRLHKSGIEHGGIVVVSPDPDPQPLSDRISRALGEGPDLAGRLVRVNRGDG
jgi:hypothetical protein